MCEGLLRSFQMLFQKAFACFKGHQSCVAREVWKSVRIMIFKKGVVGGGSLCYKDKQLIRRLELALWPPPPLGPSSPHAPPAHQPCADSNGKHHHPLHRLIPATFLFTKEKNDCITAGLWWQQGGNTFQPTSFRLNSIRTASTVMMSGVAGALQCKNEEH